MPIDPIIFTDEETIQGTKCEAVVDEFSNMESFLLQDENEKIIESLKQMGYKLTFILQIIIK